MRFGATATERRSSRRRWSGAEVGPVSQAADPPSGVVADHVSHAQELPHEAGDRVLFLLDGVLERNDGRLDVRALVTDTADQHPRTPVQHLLTAVLDAADGDWTEISDEPAAQRLSGRGEDDGPDSDRGQRVTMRESVVLRPSCAMPDCRDGSVLVRSKGILSYRRSSSDSAARGERPSPMTAAYVRDAALRRRWNINGCSDVAAWVL